MQHLQGQELTLSCMDAEKPQLPSDFEAVTWLKLEDAIRAVHEKRAVSSSLEELYRVRGSQLCHTFGCILLWRQDM